MYSIDKLPSVIEIGRAGEKNFREVEFDLSAWMVEMPAGVPSLIVNRPGESEDAAYIAGTTFADNILTWTVTDSDTAFVGTGNIQIWLEEEDPETLTTGKRGKSVIVAVRIEESLTSGSTEVPDPQTTWMEQMTELSTNVTNAKTAAETAQGLAEAAQSAAEGAQTAAETAQGLAETAQGLAETAQTAAETAQSGAEAAAEHYPYVDTDTGKWMVWDTDEGTFVSTGVDAQGPQGETGASGQDGTSEYVHIKYSASEPTQDSDMKDTADAWMGVYSGSSSTAPTTHASYTWYKIKGATGTGVPDGGTAGQYVKKISGSENDTTWESPVAGLTETTAGKILDATQGKVLNDKITTVSGEIAIIVDGNSVNQSLTTGDYIVLMNSTISGVTDGLYKMAANVASNTAIVAANLTAVSGGIGSQVKTLNGQISPFISGKGLWNGDIDSYKTTGCGWIQRASASGTQPSNFLYYSLTVNATGYSGIVYQTAVELGTGKTATRLFANNSWSSWLCLSEQISSFSRKSKYDTSISVPANDIASGDFDVSSSPGDNLMVVGFDISSSTSVLPMQIYMSDKNTIHYRLRNISGSAQTCALYVYYC